MKRAIMLTLLLLSAAGYVFLQTTAPAPKLATLLPGGALLCLESPDFGRLLRDWDGSTVKAEWLESGNFETFSRSNLFTKLSDVYKQYGEAAGFLPDLRGVGEIAGTDSALALYGIRDVEFLYVTRIGDATLMKSQLWAVREKFQQRQAGGVAFFVRTDPDSKRTVAFAFANGYLFIATRDDLVAQALELAAGAANPSVASDRWYREATAAASNPGELRLAMNLELLTQSVYFRSYWVQPNASVVGRYWAGVADLRRTAGSFTEDRVFLRKPEAAAQAVAADAGVVPALLALVPPEAGVYKAWARPASSDVAGMIVEKLIGIPPARERNWLDAPSGISLDDRAGGEGDLETRIDEQPLPADAGTADSIAAVRALVDGAGARGILLLQSSEAGDSFVRMPAAIVISGAQDWDSNAVRRALTAASGKLWTTSGLGAGWTAGTAGRHPVERLNGLGTLLFAIRGRMLFIGDDPVLLAAALDRGGPGPTGPLTYAAGFRHGPERGNFERVMTALDFASASGGRGFRGAPSFFSGNIASLSNVLANVVEIRVTQAERGAATIERVTYQLQQ